MSPAPQDSVLRFIALGLVLAACRPTPQRTPTTTPTISATLPPTTRAPWVGLAGASYAFVDTGAWEFGGLADRKGTWLLWTLATPEMDDDGGWTLGPSLHGSEEETTALSVSREQLRQLGNVSEAPERVWLVGSQGVCEATLSTQAQADHYIIGFETVEIAFALRDCDGPDWAPVAIVGVQPPEDLRWVTPTTTFDIDGQPSGDATPALVDAVRSEVDQLQAADDPRSATLYGHVRELVGTTPRVAETFSGVEWEDEPVEDDEALSCGTDATWSLMGGVVVDASLVPWKTPKDFGGLAEHDLLGAFVRGERVHAVVFAEGLDLVVFTPTAETLMRGHWSGLPTGEYHDEDIVAHSERLGGGCDP